MENLKHDNCETCYRMAAEPQRNSPLKLSNLLFTAASHSAINTQDKAMSRIWEKMEVAVDHIMMTRRCQHHYSLHSLEKITNSTNNREKLGRTNKLRCRGDVDYDIGLNTKVIFNNVRLAHKP